MLLKEQQTGIIMCVGPKSPSPATGHRLQLFDYECYVNLFTPVKRKQCVSERELSVRYEDFS